MFNAELGYLKEKLWSRTAANCIESVVYADRIAALPQEDKGLRAAF